VARIRIGIAHGTLSRIVGTRAVAPVSPQNVDSLKGRQGVRPYRKRFHTRARLLLFPLKRPPLPPQRFAFLVPGEGFELVEVLVRECQQLGGGPMFQLKRGFLR
jgi:hypothetical protein